MGFEASNLGTLGKAMDEPTLPQLNLGTSGPWDLKLRSNLGTLG